MPHSNRSYALWVQPNCNNNCVPGWKAKVWAKLQSKASQCKTHGYTDKDVNVSKEKLQQTLSYPLLRGDKKGSGRGEGRIEGEEGKGGVDIEMIGGEGTALITCKTKMRGQGERWEAGGGEECKGGEGRDEGAERAEEGREETSAIHVAKP
ncbi:hypothetical protein BDQ17DRAFT_1333384 [Cyathus striatus]|nr:hypothetical protein BDQ17DRAFT_1333384 [Cyathus striatus]